MKVGNSSAALRRTLRTSTSVCALCLGASVLFSGAARADCDDNTPAAGTTVTCTAPVDTTGISGGNDNVTIDVLTGAVIDGNGPDAINIGDDAVITTQTGSEITAMGANDLAIFTGDRAFVSVAGTLNADHDVLSVGDDSQVILRSGGLIAGLANPGRGIVAGNNALIVTEAGSTITTRGDSSSAGAVADAISVGNDAVVDLSGDIFVSRKAQAVIGGENLTVMMHEGATISVTGYVANAAAPGAAIEAQGGGANITINGSVFAQGTGGTGADGIRIGQANSATPLHNTIVIGSTGSVMVEGANSQAIIIERPGAPGAMPPPTTHDIFVADGGVVSSLNNAAIIEDPNGIAGGLALTSLTVAGTVSTGVGGGVAVDLFSGDDRLELHNTFAIVGDVLGGDGTDLFVLGGDLNGTFDMASLDGDGVDEGEQFLGFETYLKEDGSIWTLIGTNDETFNWDVVAGGILANGVLVDSHFNLSPGVDPALLGGAGTIGSFFADEGATVLPGNFFGDIATLTVTQGLDFEAGSTFMVDLDGTPVSDLIEGSGVATLNGGVIQVNAFAGPYSNGEIFTIIDVDTLGGAGAFDPVVFDNLFLYDFTALYTPGAGLVQLRADLNLSSTVAMTPNEMGSARGIETADLDDPALADLQALLPLIDNLTDAKLLLNGLSGEIYATNQLLSAQTGALFTQAIRHRGRVQGANGTPAMMMADSGGTQLAAAALDDDTSPFSQVAASGAMEESGGITGWVGFFGQVNSFDEDGNATDVDHWVAGAAAGLETGWHGDGVSGSAGIGFGYSRSSGDIGEGRDSDVDSNGYHVGLYGTVGTGGFSLSGAVSYAFIASDVTRTLPFGLGETQADVDSNVFSTSFEASYGIAVSEMFTVGPLAGFDATWVSQDGFTESGAGPALQSDGNDYASYTTALGGRLSGVFAEDGSMSAAWELDAKWRHRFGDDATNADLSYVSGSSTFDVYGPEYGTDWAEVGAGLQVRSGSLSVGVRYDGDFGGGFNSHALSLNVGTSF